MYHRLNVQTLWRGLQNKRIVLQTICDGEQTDWDVVYIMDCGLYNMSCNTNGITDSNSKEYNNNDYSDCKSSKDRKYSGFVHF